MASLSKLNRRVLKFLHRFQHTAQGESATVYFESLDADNAADDLASFAEFQYDDRAADGSQLPPDVAFELRISEELIDPSALLNARGDCLASSVRHETPQGTMRYRLLQPSPFWPQGVVRYWRFWLGAAQLVEATMSGDFVITSDGDFEITSDGDFVVWQ